MAKPWWETSGLQVYQGDCRTVLPDLPSCGVDAIVTDPPYELGFMSRRWDSTGIAFDPGVWAECLRVLKPGGYLLSFGGTRTYHRMACAIEDAGFIIHPLLGWVFGSGFPKATNLSKQLDKRKGAERPVVGKYRLPDTGREHADHRTDSDRHTYGSYESCVDSRAITESVTEEAKQWDGWSYGLQSLKPAIEPICMAQKPISELRMVDNILRWGVGAVNIDACRIGTEWITKTPSNMSRNNKYAQDAWTKSNPIGEHKTYQGRWPANVLFDEPAAGVLDQMTGDLGNNYRKSKANGRSSIFGSGKSAPCSSILDSGGTSRFFYVAKARKRNAVMAITIRRSSLCASWNTFSNWLFRRVA